jgi:hypothetical protein
VGPGRMARIGKTDDVFRTTQRQRTNKIDEPKRYE